MQAARTVPGDASEQLEELSVCLAAATCEDDRLRLLTSAISLLTLNAASAYTADAFCSVIGDYCALQSRDSGYHAIIDSVVMAGCIPALFSILQSWTSVAAVVNSACAALWSLSAHGGRTAQSAILAQPGCAELLLAASRVVRDARVNWPHAVLQSLGLASAADSILAVEDSATESSSLAAQSTGAAFVDQKQREYCLV